MDDLARVIANAVADCDYHGHGTFDAPDFDHATKVHDWRNHVPQEACDHWGEMGDEARAFVYIMARQGAHNEEWD